MKLNKFIGTTATILFVIFATIFIIQLILKLTGHSPTETQLLYIGMSGIISFLLAMSYKAGVFVGEVNEFMKTTKNSFAKLNEDMSGLKRR